MPIPRGTEALAGKGAPLAFRLSARLLACLPPRALALLGRAAGALHYLLARTKRRNFAANTSQAPLGRSSLRVGLGAFGNQAANTLELLGAAGGALEALLERFHLEGLEHLGRALRGGRGLVLVTYHGGNWELAGLALARRGFPITTVAGEQLRPGWSEAVKSFKGRYGIEVVSPGAALRRLYRALEQGRIVVLHLDGNLFTGGLDLPFLGGRATFPVGPARLARRTGSPVAFARCLRRGSWFWVQVGPPRDGPRDGEEEKRLLAELVAEMEKCVLDAPEQWCIFRRLVREVR